MLDRKEIEKRLKNVDPQLCVAFAARCSLRVLPALLSDKEKDAFWYWDKEKCPQHVLALLTAQQVSINFSAFGRKINIAAAAYAAARANINIEQEILQDLDVITSKYSKLPPVDFLY